MKKILVSGLLMLLVGLVHADWQYLAQEDKMTGKPSKRAYLESNNTLALDFPYNGRNHGILQVRKDPKHGTNVLVRVEKGQILCRSYEPCTISVRFDSAQPVRFSGVGSGDHDSKIVFFNSEPKFIAAAKKAKKILIQLTMYQAGEQVLEFQSSKPLEWNDK